MFEYMGVWHLLVSDEDQSIQIFDFESGMSIFEFNFSKRNPDQI